MLFGLIYIILPMKQPYKYVTFMDILKAYNQSHLHRMENNRLEIYDIYLYKS
jgi:hypothetical protein